VQSLLARQGRGGSFNDELEMQYKAQVDVVGQLQDKLHRQLQQQEQLISTTGSGGSKPTYPPSSASDPYDRTTWLKLRRDFERVQTRANQLQESVQRMRANLKQRPASSSMDDDDMRRRQEMDPQAALEYQQQLQLQQDVSGE
jgi:hypothetical protein